MKIWRILRRLARPAAFLLALIMSFVFVGCEQSDVQDIIDIAGEVIELLDDTSYAGGSDSGGDTNDTEQAETAPTEATRAPTAETAADTSPIDENGSYYSKEDVALYIHTYGKLPNNFINKNEAEKLGWEGGSVERYAEGCAIGGDRFGNREGLLPKKSGRVYTECDIDTKGKPSRGAKRIVFSNDGLIYYTDDHYETFTLLYGKE